MTESRGFAAVSNSGLIRINFPRVEVEDKGLLLALVNSLKGFSEDRIRE